MTRTEAASRWSAKRFSLLAVLAVAVGMAAPMSASAAPPYPVGAGLQSDGVLSYVAGTGRANSVTVTPAGDGYTIADTGVTSIPNADSSGLCTFATNPASATCPAPSPASESRPIWINVGDGNDSIVLDPSIGIGASLFSRGGDDQITSRDGASDQVTCGSGSSDSVIVDVLDFVFSDCEAVDDGAPPETTIDPASGPPAFTSDTSARFSFSSNESGSTFECSIDGGDFAPCTPSTTYTDLQEGPHSFQVRATDHSGNGLTDQTPAERRWTVGTTPPPPSTIDGGVAPATSSSAPSRPAESLVLIAGRAVKASRRGLVSVALNCSGTKDCAGTVILSTSKPVRYSGKRKKVVRLGSRKFEIDAGRTRKVRVRLSRRKMRLLHRLRRVSADVSVRDRDRAGRARVGTRTIVLKAPR
jgi:hypothetical protein